MYGLHEDELRILKKLSTPIKIQDYLDTLPINYEKKGETCMSPREVLKAQKAHCLEGALLAATALRLQGNRPLLLNFKTTRGDQDHAIALYRINGYWGAISKANHPILRFRDPIFKTPRELALSFFHEYFLSETGKKSLIGYSKPFDLRPYGTEWITSSKNLWQIADALAASEHLPFVPPENAHAIRNASEFERNSVEQVEWPRSHPGV